MPLIISAPSKFDPEHSPQGDGAATFRFDAIEGLRAWLAFGVFAFHLSSITNITSLSYQFRLLGSDAVLVFMIVSGFVISHLLMTRREAYIPYITRRAFRLFPAYWIALGLGVITTFLRLEAIEQSTWTNAPSFAPYLTEQALHAQVIVEQPVVQSILHLTLSQVLAPQAIATDAGLAMLGPAWSLSIEWQFYLIAPIMIWMMRRPGWIFVAISTVALGFYLAQLGFRNAWTPDSSVFAFLFLFGIGAASRFALPLIRQLGSYAWPIAFALVIVGKLTGEIVTSLWLAFLVLMVRSRATRGVQVVADRIFDVAFESRVAKWLGARSYSIYILHTSAIAFVAWVVIPLYPLTSLQAFGLIGVLSIVLTVVASDLLHRWVELPMIAWGARIANANKAAPQVAYRTTTQPS